MILAQHKATKIINEMALTMSLYLLTMVLTL